MVLSPTGTTAAPVVTPACDVAVPPTVGDAATAAASQKMKEKLPVIPIKNPYKKSTKKYSKVLHKFATPVNIFDITTMGKQSQACMTNSQAMKKSLSINMLTITNSSLMIQHRKCWMARLPLNLTSIASTALLRGKAEATSIRRGITKNAPLHLSTKSDLPSKILVK
jgi:hypothetical protein